MAKNKDKNRDKRIANLIPCKPGQTANPNGRPVGQKNYATLYREGLIHLAKLNGKEPDILEVEMLSNAIKLARAGDYRFYKDILDRKHGQAVAPIVVEDREKIESAIDKYLNDNTGNNKEK
jgi:hypothetical protein